MIKSWKTKVGDWIIVLICCVLIFICLVPLLNVLARSLSSSYYLNRNEVLLWPKGLNFDAYTNVLRDSKYTYSLGYTAVLTLACGKFRFNDMDLGTLGGLPRIMDMEKLKENGKKMIVFNVLNFGECVDSRPHKEKAVSEYNKILEENKDSFYAVYDQAALCVNPEKPHCSKKEYLGKDYLHPNREGGQIVADGIDLELFR